jgi:Domain of unknown function (DUF4032)
MPRGDITAGEIYEDRELLNRLGYGIFDVNFGSSSIGFENIKDFTYVVAPDEDPRLYRRRVFDLTGRYFPTNLAKAIWNKLVDHKWVFSEEAGHEVSLRAAAEDWMERYSQGFLKEWTFNQPDNAIPGRIRNRKEPRKGWLGLVTGLVMPDFKQLLDAGFTVKDVIKASVEESFNNKVWRNVKKLNDRAERKNRHLAFPIPFISSFYLRPSLKPKHRQNKDQNFFAVEKLPSEDRQDGLYYVRLIANMTGHEPQTPEEAENLWCEILEHKWYMSEREGRDVGVQAAAIDYFRRLNLMQAYETGDEL